MRNIIIFFRFKISTTSLVAFLIGSKSGFLNSSIGVGTVIIKISASNNLSLLLVKFLLFINI